MTENQLTAQPLLPWGDFSAAAGIDQMPIPDRLATFKNYTAYVDEYGKELDSKTPEEGKPALRDWAAQQNDWATKERESLLAGDFVPWQDVEKSPSFQNATNSERLRSFANYTNYFEDYADLKARNTPEQDRPAVNDWAKSQREWLMGGMDQAVEQYTLGGKVFSMTPMEQIDFLRTKDQSVAAGFTEEEWKQTREQFEDNMIPLLEKHMIASGATKPMERGPSGLESPAKYSPPQDPVAKKEFWKNVLWNEPKKGVINDIIERLPFESIAGIMSMVSGLTDAMSRDLGGRTPGGSFVAGTGERRSDAVSQALGKFSDATRKAQEDGRASYPFDPRFSSDEQTIVSAVGQAPGQIAPFMVPIVGPAIGLGGMYGQLNQEAQDGAYQAALSNKYKESVLSGSTPIGTPVSAYEKTLDSDVREDLRSKVAVQSALAAVPATAMDFFATKMILGLQAVPGSKSVAKWLSRFRETKPGLGMATKIGTDFLLKTGTGTASEVAQQGITNLNAATVSRDFSLGSLSEGFREAALGGVFGEGTMAVVGVNSSIKEQNRFLWAKGVLSGSVDPNLDPRLANLRQGMYAAEATEKTDDPEYRVAAKTWAAKRDEANWVLRAIGDPEFDEKSAERHVIRSTAQGNFRSNLMQYLRDSGVQSSEDILRQRDADLESARENIANLRELHRGNPIVEAGVDRFEENLVRSANEKAEKSISDAEKKTQEFLGSVGQDGEGRADYARLVIANKFTDSDFLFSPEFNDDAVVTEVLDGIEQDLITDNTDLTEWLKAPASPTTATAAAPASTTQAAPGMMTTGQRLDAFRMAEDNLESADEPTKKEFGRLKEDIQFWNGVLSDKESSEQDRAEAAQRLPDLENALLEIATGGVSSQSTNQNEQNQATNQSTLPTQEVPATSAAGEGVGTGVQTIRATNADGTQADYSQEDYAEESRGIVKALESGEMTPEAALQNVEAVRMEIEAAPELTPEQKTQWLAPFQNIPAVVEQLQQGGSVGKTLSGERVNIADLKDDRGRIGKQGFTAEGVIDLINYATGSKYDSASSLKETLDAVKSAPEQVKAVKDFLERTPVKTTLEPDGTIHLDDGHHRAFLADQLGMGSLPTNALGRETKNNQTSAEPVIPTAQPAPARMNGVSGDVVRTEAGETVFRSATDGTETVLRVKEGSIEKDPAALTVDDFEGGDGTPLISEATKEFSVLPENERLARPFFRSQPQSPDGQTVKSTGSYPVDGGSTPSPATPDIAAITADVQANPDIHRFKDGNRKLVSREAAVTILSQLPETLTNKDVATLAKDSGMTSTNFRKLVALRGDQNAVGSLMNGNMDAELGLFDDMLLNMRRERYAAKVPLNDTTPAAKVSNDANTESTVVGQSSVDRWVNDSFTAIEQAAAELPQSSINASLFREKLTTDEGRAGVREKLGQMFNTVVRNLKISDPVVREEAMEKIFRGALQKQTGEGLTSNVLEDLLTNLQKTGDPFLVKSKGGEVGYSAWLKHRNKQNEFMQAQSKRDMTETLVENEGAPNSASQGVQEEEGEGTGPAFTEGDPDIEAGRAEARSMIREATQRTYERISREIAKQYGLDWESVRVAIAKHSEKTKGIKQDFDGLGWAVPQSAKIKKATDALEAAMPAIEQRLVSEMKVALRATATLAENLGLLKSDAVEISGTPTLDQIIALGVIDEIKNPDFYNAINEARESKSTDSLMPLLANFDENAIASLQTVTGIVLNDGKQITDKKQLTNLNKADMQAVLDSDLLPVRLRQTLQTLVDLSGEDGLGLVRNSKNEGFRRLAELYSEQIGNRAPVEVVFNLGLNPSVTGQGLWSTGSNRVHISPFLTREKGLMEATILHEVMHPIWDSKINNYLRGNTTGLNEKELAAITELERLFSFSKAEAQKRLDTITDPDERRIMERNLLGTTNLREFLNEALNHRPFQEFLSELKDPNADGKNSVFRTILNKILELIRGGKVSLDSVLQRAFELSTDIASSNKPLSMEQRTPSQAEYIGEQETLKGRPLTEEEVSLAAVNYAMQNPRPRFAESQAQADQFAAEYLSDEELDAYNYNRQRDGQPVLSSDIVVSDQQIFEAIKANGGITIDVWTAGQPGTGIVVAPFKETETKIPLNTFAPQDVNDFMEKFRPLLEVPGMHLGGWVSDDTVYLDVSIVTEDEVTATILAEDGNQLAVYNIGTGEFPSTPELVARNSGALAERRKSPDIENLARSLQQAFGRAVGGIQSADNRNVPTEGALPELGILEPLTGQPLSETELESFKVMPMSWSLPPSNRRGDLLLNGLIAGRGKPIGAFRPAFDSEGNFIEGSMPEGDNVEFRDLNAPLGGGNEYLTKAQMSELINARGNDDKFWSRNSFEARRVSGGEELSSKAVFPAPDEKFAGYTQIVDYIEGEYGPKAKALKSWINDSVVAYTASYVSNGNHGQHYIQYNPLTMLSYTRGQVDAVMREEMIHAASGFVLMKKGIGYSEFYEDLGKSLSSAQRSKLKSVYRSTNGMRSVGAEYFRAAIQKLLYGTITEAEMQETPMKKIVALLRDFVSYFRRKLVDPVVRDVYEDTVRILQKIDKKNAQQDPELGVLSSVSVPYKEVVDKSLRNVIDKAVAEPAQTAFLKPEEFNKAAQSLAVIVNDPVAGKVKARGGRAVNLNSPDDSTARKLEKATGQRWDRRLLDARVIHALTEADRTTPNANKVASAPMVPQTLRQADFVARTDFEGRPFLVFAKLYNDPESPTGVRWHFVEAREDTGAFETQYSTTDTQRGRAMAAKVIGIGDATPKKKKTPTEAGYAQGPSEVSSSNPQGIGPDVSSNQGEVLDNTNVESVQNKILEEITNLTDKQNRLAQSGNFDGAKLVGDQINELTAQFDKLSSSELFSGPVENLGKMWQEAVAKEGGDAFAYGLVSPEVKTFSEIFKTVIGEPSKDFSLKFFSDGVEVSSEEWDELARNNGGAEVTITDPDGGETVLFSGFGAFAVNSAGTATSGSAIYQAFYAWAHNNGKVVGPDTSLSEAGELRRTSQMLSSALRFGTTQHIRPSAEQQIKGWRRVELDKDGTPWEISDMLREIGGSIFIDDALDSARPRRADGRMTGSKFNQYNEFQTDTVLDTFSGDYSNPDSLIRNFGGYTVKARRVSMEEAQQAWRENTGLLAKKETELVFERIPELKGLSISKDGYLLGPDENYLGSTRALPSGNTDEYLGTLLSTIRRSDPEFARRIGPATLARALATRFAEANKSNPSLLSSSTEEVGGTFSPFKDTLYSASVPEQIGTPEDKAVDAIDAAARSFANKAKHLTPAERGKLRSNTRETFVRIFNDLPSEKEFAAAAIGGQAKRGWYRASSQAIIEVFGVDAPRFAALLAATSPQTSVENNLINALNIWKNWTAAGRPTDRKAILKVMGQSVMGNKGEDSVLDAWVNNSTRALTSENPEALVISGPKVNSFMLNLRGFVDEVTNDAWMANFALVDQVIFKGSLNAAGTDPGKGPGYLAMSARVRAAASYLTKLTGEEWTPAEVQETVWSWAKTLYELQERQGENRTALEILQAGELTDDAIASTPDFATLLNNGTYKQILKEAGYGEALERLAQSDTGSTGETQQRFNPETGSAIGKTIRTLQERSAKRLTQLYTQRQEEAARKADAAKQTSQEDAVIQSAPVAPFQGNVVPGFNPSVYTPASSRNTEALKRVLSDPNYTSVRLALTDKRYFAWTEKETLAKANEFIDALNGNLETAYNKSATTYGITPEQTILIRGLAMKRAQSAANVARAEMAKQNTPAARRTDLQFIAQHYSDMAETFAEDLMETASLAGQELRAFRLLADTLSPQSWVKTYKRAATRAQQRKFQKDEVLSEMMDRIKEARRIAASSTTARMQKALDFAAKRFLPEGTSDEEIKAHTDFARVMANQLPVRDAVVQAAVEQTVIDGLETIRRSVAPEEQVPESFLREWENRLRSIASEQINAIIEERLAGGQVDAEAAPELSDNEKEAMREQKITDAWREFSDFPISEIVFSLAKATIVASDSPYANLVRRAQFDPTRIKKLREAVKLSIDTSNEIQMSVGDRRMTVDSLKLRLSEANPNLNEAQLAKLSEAVEAVYNEEVGKATRLALDGIIRKHAEKQTAKKIAKDSDFTSRLLPLVNMGAFSDEAAYNAIADRLRLPAWNPDTAAEIEAKARALQEFPEDSIQRQEASVQLMSDILKANVKEARGMQNFGPLMQIASALWSAGILSAPPTQIVNASMTTASVFLQSFTEASGYWVAATRKGATQEQARAYFGDMARAWVFAFGKDANNTSLRAVNEAFAALTKGQTKFKSEKLESLSPLEMFKFDPRVAIPGNKMMEAIISGEGKTAIKEAAKMAIGVPMVMAQRVFSLDAKGAVKDYMATMKLVGRFMLAADSMNSYGAAVTKQMMMRRYLAQEEGMSPQEIDKVMREAREGGNEAVRDAAMTQVETEAQRGDFGPAGSKTLEVAKARRMEQLIENQTYGTETVNAGRDFAATATFNNEPYGVVGFLMDTIFGNTTKVLGLATKPINPFPKTMSNLINAAIDYTPYGSVRAMGWNLGAGLANNSRFKPYVKEAPERGTPEYYALHSRAVAGTAAMGIIYMMVMSAVKDREEGKEPWFEIHGPGPGDPKARKQFRESGAKAFSLRMGGLVINYTDWPGLNIALAAFGTLYDQLVYSDAEMETSEWFMQTARAIVGTTLNRSALGGASALFNALATSTSSTVFENAVKGLGASYVTGFTRPAFIRWAETMVTGQRQETRTDAGWLLSMAPVVSVFRDRPALNLLGEPIETSKWDATAGRVVTTQETHPVLTPLTNANLWINPPEVYKTYDPSKPSMVRDITQAEFYDYSKAYGEALSGILTPKEAEYLAEMSKTAPNTAQETLNSYSRMAANEAKNKMADRGLSKGKELKGP